MTNSVSGVVSTVFSGFGSELWTLAPAALAIAGIIWGVPKALSFAKRVAK
jgi:hypothetical protein